MGPSSTLTHRFAELSKTFTIATRSHSEYSCSATKRLFTTEEMIEKIAEPEDECGGRADLRQSSDHVRDTFPLRPDLVTNEIHHGIAVGSRFV